MVASGQLAPHPAIKQRMHGEADGLGTISGKEGSGSIVDQPKPRRQPRMFVRNAARAPARTEGEKPELVHLLQYFRIVITHGAKRSRHHKLCKIACHCRPDPVGWFVVRSCE